MGNDQSELASAMRELRLELRQGGITQAEFDSQAAELQSEYNPQFAPEQKTMPSARPWVPSKRDAVLGKGLGKDFAIDPETGRVIPLTKEAAERMTVTPGKSGDGNTSKSKRFPSGSCVVLGVKRNGDLVSKSLAVGAATADPYQVGARIAARIVERGGMAWYGYRLAGYDITGDERDSEARIRAAQIGQRLGDLIPSGDKKIGKSQTVGQNGPKGLVLIDAATQQPVRPMDAIVFLAWLLACGKPAQKAAKLLSRFIRRPRTSKAELEMARTAAFAAAASTPYAERPYTEHFATGTTNRLNYSTREYEKELCQVAIGCSTLDMSLPVDPEGIPFSIYWQHAGDGITHVAAATPGVLDRPAAGVFHHSPAEMLGEGSNIRTDWADVDPADFEACQTHARVLALQGAGTYCVQHVSWVDEAGTRHYVTRSDALRHHSESGDDLLDEIRSNFDPRNTTSAQRKEYAATLVAYLDPLSHQFRDTREDEWREAHERAEAAAQALRDTEKDSEEERKQIAALHKAEKDRLQAERASIGNYEKPGAVMSPGAKRQEIHSWPTKRGRAKNSPRGGTWGKRAAAQGLDPSWRK